MLLMVWRPPAGQKPPAALVVAVPQLGSGDAWLQVERAVSGVRGLMLAG
jgi:hypothetical protein